MPAVPLAARGALPHPTCPIGRDSSAGASKAQPAQDAGADGAGTDSAGTVHTRQVVTTGTVSLTVKSPIDAAQRAADIVDAAGGRVDDRTENPATDDHRAGATLTLRIPSDRLTATLSKIKELGTVESVSTSSRDVTTTAEDLDARITALQTSVDRLLDLMTKANDAADLLKIESALSERQGNLESLQAQRTTLAGQVDLATVTLELSVRQTVATTVPDDFWSGLASGWTALVVAAAAVMVFLGVALPWLVLVAVVVAIVIGGVRLSRKRKNRPAPGDPR